MSSKSESDTEQNNRDEKAQQELRNLRLAEEKIPAGIVGPSPTLSVPKSSIVDCLDHLDRCNHRCIYSHRGQLLQDARRNSTSSKQRGLHV